MPIILMPATETQTGLRDAFVGCTTLSSINGDESKLIYRGFDIHDLAQDRRSTKLLTWYDSGRFPPAQSLPI